MTDRFGPSAPAPLAEMRDISILIDGTMAVDRLTVDLYPGEVLGLLGDGAGSSALIRFLSGAVRTDGGKILIDAHEVEINDPRDARALNIVTIYRTLALAENLNAAANLFLGREPADKIGRVDEARMEAETRRIIARLSPGFTGFDLPVLALSDGERQAIAIARAVHCNARILILDEPTATLGPQDMQMLVDVLQTVKALGIGVLLCDRDIQGAMHLCDRVGVMQNGQLTGTVNVDDGIDDDNLGMIIAGKKPRHQAA